MDNVLYYNNNAYMYQTEDEMNEAARELYELQRNEERPRTIDYCLRQHGVRISLELYVIVSKKKHGTWELLGETRHYDLAACIAENAIKKLHINKDDIFIAHLGLGFMTFDHAMEGPLKPVNW